MIAHRLLALFSACTALLAVPACSSSGGHHATAPSSKPASAAGLADALAKGVGGISSAQISLDASLSGQQIHGSGPAQFAFGTGLISALDLTGDVPGIGHVRIVLSNGKLYATLPKSFNATGKPWILVSTNSTSPLVSQFAGVAEKIRSAASLDTLATLVRAAKSVTNVGSGTTEGIATTHYSVVVDTAKLPESFPGRSDLAGVLKDKPVDLWLDDTNRPVRVTRDFVLLGTPVAVTIGAHDFNQPVTITAPPAGDVAGG